MKIGLILLCWVVEIAIAVGLIWKHIELDEIGISSFILPILPAFIMSNWLFLRKGYKEHKYGRAIQSKLFLTGISIFLCFSILFSINYELIKIRSVGGATKEMGIALTNRIMSKKMHTPESIQQCMECTIDKLKTDNILYVLLLASLCLLYGNRYFSGKKVQISQEKHKIVAIESRSDAKAANKNIIS